MDREKEELIQQIVKEIDEAPMEQKIKWVTAVQHATENFSTILEVVTTSMPELKELGVHDTDIPRVDAGLKHLLSYHYEEEGIVQESLKFNIRIDEGKMKISPGNLYTTMLSHGIWVNHELILGVGAFETKEVFFIYCDDVFLILPAGFPAIKLFSFNRVPFDSPEIRALNDMFKLPGVEENNV